MTGKTIFKIFANLDQNPLNNKIDWISEIIFGHPGLLFTFSNSLMHFEGSRNISHFANRNLSRFAYAKNFSLNTNLYFMHEIQKQKQIFNISNLRRGEVADVHNQKISIILSRRCQVCLEIFTSFEEFSSKDGEAFFDTCQFEYGTVGSLQSQHLGKETISSPI